MLIEKSSGFRNVEKHNNTVAEMLADIEDSGETQDAFKYRLELVKQLRTCASEQGVGNASSNLGANLELAKKYSEAVKSYHQGVKMAIRYLH